MHVLSLMFRVAVQIAIVVFVPGGLPAVRAYQYRRLLNRRREAMTHRTENPPPPVADGRQAIPESPH